MNLFGIIIDPLEFLVYATLGELFLFVLLILALIIQGRLSLTSIRKSIGMLAPLMAVLIKIVNETQYLKKEDLTKLLAYGLALQQRPDKFDEILMRIEKLFSERGT